MTDLLRSVSETSNISRAGLAWGLAGCAMGAAVSAASLFVDAQMPALHSFHEGLTATFSSSLKASLTLVPPLVIGSVSLAVGRGRQRLHEQLRRLRQSETAMREHAHRDAVTGLFNRAYLTKSLEEGLATRRWKAGGALLYMLDLQDFKHVNDTHGHLAGDRVLKEVARRLETVAGEDDITVRLGGDEFVVVHCPTHDETFPDLFADRLLTVLTEEMTLGDVRITPSIFIGVAPVGLDGDTWSDVMRSADVALHQAKLEPTSAYRIFQPEMKASRDRELAMEAEMRVGIDRGEFELYYQPIYGTESGVIRSFEALVRWNHPEMGMIPPMEFIPLAESSGLIIRLGRKILSEACRTAATWPKPIGIGVNLSPIQFNDADLVDHVEAALAESGLAPGRLDLEITESLLLEPSSRVNDTLKRLQELGVRITMDDFGTGYSSLGNLRNFRFNRLKIDRCFTRDVAGNSDDAEIVRTIVRLSRTLRMETILEGVENEDQLEFARSEGLTEVQGFYYAKPMTRASVALLLDERGAAEPADIDLSASASAA